MEHRRCIFRFADVEVDESNFSVTKSGEPLPLEPKVFKVLQFLLHHPGRVVTKDELLDAVWSDTSVSESSLTRSVATLRRILGDDIPAPIHPPPARLIIRVTYVPCRNYETGWL
jgi:DNA-binding winged helix-turn-helix (wHTH) protein